MRTRFTLFLLMSAVVAVAQLPPISVEWSAVRQYVPGPSAHVTRDVVTGEYLWAEYNDFQGAGDEVAYPFLADGTDVSPLFPERFNVGSLDHLIDVQLHNGVAYCLMFHLAVGNSGGVPFYWHLNNAPEGTGLTMTNASVQPEASEMGFDLLVTDDAAYACGWSDTNYPDSAIARLVKTDLQCDLLWSATWDDPSLARKGFSSVAALGDSMICAALPHLVIFDSASGSLINAVDVSTGLTSVTGDATCMATGGRIYWVLADTLGLRVGYHDPGIGANVINAVSNEPMRLGRIAVDQYGHIWVTSTATNGTDWTESDDEGRWHRFDPELIAIDNGVLHASIDDMCLVNGKISFTGLFDTSLTTAYLITGTPQP